MPLSHTRTTLFLLWHVFSAVYVCIDKPNGQERGFESSARRSSAPDYPRCAEVFLELCSQSAESAGIWKGCWFDSTDYSEVHEKDSERQCWSEKYHRSPEVLSKRSGKEHVWVPRSTATKKANTSNARNEEIVEEVHHTKGEEYVHDKQVTFSPSGTKEAAPLEEKVLSVWMKKKRTPAEYRDKKQKLQFLSASPILDLI